MTVARDEIEARPACDRHGCPGDACGPAEAGDGGIRLTRLTDKGG